MALNSIGLQEMETVNRKTTPAPSRCCCHSGSCRGGRADKEIKRWHPGQGRRPRRIKNSRSREKREFQNIHWSHGLNCTYSILLVLCFSVWSKILVWSTVYLQTHKLQADRIPVSLYQMCAIYSKDKQF